MKPSLHITKPLTKAIYDLKVLHRKVTEEEKEEAVIDISYGLFFSIDRIAEYIKLIHQGEKCSAIGALTCMMYSEQLYIDLAKGGHLIDDQARKFLEMIIANRKALSFDNNSYLMPISYIKELGLGQGKD